MILIAHRGNTNGPRPEKENTTVYLKTAIDNGFSVETDIWYLGRNFYLGHDEPKEKFSINALNKETVWYHAQNFQAFERLLKEGLICFWHKDDKFTLASNGYIWAHSGSYRFGEKVIYVCPEKLSIKMNYLNNCAGICSDYVQNYDKINPS